MFPEKWRQKLQPDLTIHALEEINPALLKRHGIVLLCLDGDQTLFDGNHKVIPAKRRAWLETLQQQGIQIALLSNNFAFSTSRLSGLGLQSVHRFSLKPLPFVFEKVERQSGLQSHQIAMLGDQLLSDILGANLQGWTSIHYDHPKTGLRPDQKMVAFLENRFLKRR